MALAGCSNKQIYSETSCSIDWVNGSAESIVSTNRANTLKVEGWAADILSKQAPESISINLVSSAGVVSEFVEGKLTIARSDVNAALNAPSITNAGFSLSAKLKSQAPDTYEIQILQHFSDRILVCKSNKRIRIE
jgi:hypothetical protein